MNCKNIILKFTLILVISLNIIVQFLEYFYKYILFMLLIKKIYFLLIKFNLRKLQVNSIFFLTACRTNTYFQKQTKERYLE